MSAKPPPKDEAPTMQQVTDDEPFLSRWSRLKAGGGESLEPAPDSAAIPEESAPASQSDAPAPVKTDADMPPIESLGEDSSFSDFLSPGVSEELRRMALRKLFHLPGLNVVDGLDDYDDDFRDFAALGKVMTAARKFRDEVERAREQAEGQGPAEEACTEQAPVARQEAAREAPAEVQEARAAAVQPGAVDLQDEDNGENGSIDEKRGRA